MLKSFDGSGITLFLVGDLLPPAFPSGREGKMSKGAVIPLDAVFCIFSYKWSWLCNVFNKVSFHVDYVQQKGKMFKKRKTLL